MKYERPPLGLIPCKIYSEHTNYSRINDIVDAMYRYAAADKVCPQDWVTELSELVREMHKRDEQ